MGTRNIFANSHIFFK